MITFKDVKQVIEEKILHANICSTAYDGTLVGYPAKKKSLDVEVNLKEMYRTFNVTVTTYPKFESTLIRNVYSGLEIEDAWVAFEKA